MMAPILEKQVRDRRKFVRADFVLNNWEDLLPLLDQLRDDCLDTAAQVEDWLKRKSELEAVVNEDGAWRYIRMTCDTGNGELRARFEYFIMEIAPKLAIVQNELLRKLHNASGFKQIDAEKYKTLIRGVKNEIELFREENVELGAEHSKLAREFDEVAASMSVEVQGKKVTLQKASSFLEERDRSLRQEVWETMSAERLKNKDRLNKLMTDLLGIRSRIAKNAGFASFADFKFKQLGRFDYSRKDAEAFHRAVEFAVKPELLRRCNTRARNLGLEVLRPWDLAADEFNRPPLKPFNSPEQMLEKAKRMLNRLDPQIGGYLETMEQMGYLDLGSRLGKAPGGYNYGLQETGVPFIFMNAVGTQSDLITMLHEAGHAVHSFSIHPLEIAEFKELPAEVAELASMSMELITMDFLDEVYDDPKLILRARREQLMRPISLLPWIATVDCFQFWLHDNPGHSEIERSEAWTSIFRRFHGDYVCWDGYEEMLSHFWQKQGHVYEVPFYYIEYGIAQLGALGVWRNYRKDPAKGMKDYLAALELGYSKTIPEIYERAGVRFDFSESYIREVIGFLGEELDLLEA